MSQQKIVEPLGVGFGKVSALLGALALLLGLLGSAWAGAGWAIRYKADEAVTAKLDAEHLVRAQELENFRQLLDMRMTTFEKRQIEDSNRLEYLYHRELERAGGSR